MTGNPKDKIIFALDVEHFAEAQKWVTLLKDQIGLFKVGKQLFTHAGPKVIDMIRQKSQKVSFKIGENHKGPQAVEVEVVGEAPEATKSKLSEVSYERIERTK
jgi:hypothetical protein